jgi:hypothetical protein
MPSIAALKVVVTSFFLVVLIFSLYSIPDAFARISKGPIQCSSRTLEGPYQHVTCCQTQTDSSNGLEITYCTDCVSGGFTELHNCGPRYTVHGSEVNPTGVVAPLGPNAPITNNNTGKPPPGSIIKVSPGMFGPAGNTTNPTNNTANSTAMKAAGAYSPTGFCVRSVSTSCIPCDSGLPGGRDACIPSSDWPAPSTFKNKVGLGAATPLGNATNAPPTGSNTGTPPPPPTKQVGPGCGLGTDNSTCSTSTPNPQPIHKGSNQGPSTSSSNNTGQ